MILTAFVKTSSANFSSQNLPKTAWPPWIFRKGPWETTKFLNCQETRMFQKDKKFLLHMWHPSCYSIKIFDQRRDWNQDQRNIPFFFILKYFVINEEKSQISYITMYGISHHQNDTQSANPYFCFVFCLFFVFFFDFRQFLYKLWDWKIVCAWKKQFHISRKYAFL